jgi:predicted dehydrogenase
LGWGIVAPGQIADDFAATVLANTDQTIHAVASRSAQRARRFAERHQIDLAYEGYEKLLTDPQVDIVYIAAPHAEHHRLALAAIDAGKHVLVEKPFTVSADQAIEVAAASRARGVFAAEAMWTRYLPQFDVLEQVMGRGDLGAIRLATAEVGWRIDPDSDHRLLDPAQAGGVSLDMGVYGYWLAHFAIGVPERVKVLGSRSASGVDEQAVVAIAGAHARHASVTTSFAVTNTGRASIVGTEGSAVFDEPFMFPAPFVVRTGYGEHQWKEGSGLKLREGLAWQTTAIAHYIHEGLIESPVHSLDDSIAVMRTIDMVREQVNT